MNEEKTVVLSYIDVRKWRATMAAKALFQHLHWPSRCFWELPIEERDWWRDAFLEGIEDGCRAIFLRVNPSSHWQELPVEERDRWVLEAELGWRDGIEKAFPGAVQCDAGWPDEEEAA